MEKPTPSSLPTIALAKTDSDSCPGIHAEQATTSPSIRSAQDNISKKVSGKGGCRHCLTEEEHILDHEGTGMGGAFQ